MDTQKQKVSKMVKNYAGLSDQIGDAKSQIVEDLVSLHDRLCALAQLERELEAERVKGVTRHEGLLHNEPALVESLNAHHAQLNLPAQKVWQSVNDAIALIASLNGLGTTPAAGELPDLFRRSDRVNDLTGQRSHNG